MRPHHPKTNRLSLRRLRLRRASDPCRAASTQAPVWARLSYFPREAAKKPLQALCGLLHNILLPALWMESLCALPNLERMFLGARAQGSACLSDCVAQRARLKIGSGPDASLAVEEITAIAWQRRCLRKSIKRESACPYVQPEVNERQRAFRPLAQHMLGWDRRTLSN